jgi:hypothetical protein
MHERARGVFFHHVTGLAELRAPRRAGVVSIYYDDHTPASSASHDPDLQGIAGGSYLAPPYAAGRGLGLPEANLEMDWDLDEPPTQMWAAEHARALSPRAAAPRVDRAVGARRPPPTPSSVRGTAGSTGRLYASSARASTPPPQPPTVRPHAASTGRLRALPPMERTRPFPAPMAFPTPTELPSPAPFPNRTGRHTPSPRRTGRHIPPPPPRDALFPELAHDSNFYPGLVPAAHELAEPESTPRKRHWLWYAAYVALGLTLVGAGVAAFTLWSTPTTSSVVIETTPADATVTIDGRPVAASVSPYTQAGLPTGDHVLLVQKPGFADYRQVFALGEHEAKRILFVNLSALAKAEPPPTVSEPSAPEKPEVEPHAAPPVSRWHAKAKPVSESGLSAAEIAKQHRSELRAAKIAAHWRAAHGLPPRETDVADVTEVSRPVHAKKQATREPAQTDAAERAGTNTRTSTSTSTGTGTGTGTLQINSRPWANVFVDGQMVGHTPQMALSLPAGRHQIKLVNPPMNMSKDLSVTIEAGRTLTKVETLSE